jgi:hypothetical protein
MKLSVKKISAGIIVGTVCVVSACFYLYFSPTTYVVTFTDDGYTPSYIEIRKNDTVRFTNLTTSDFWPASDFHPSHLNYSLFDPKEPVSGQDWDFQFNDAGTYSYHDHLSPGAEGVVEVSKFFSIKSAKKNFSEETNGSYTVCVEMSETNEKVSCWYDLILKVFDEEGLKNAFALLEIAHEVDPDFISLGCHGVVHEIGDYAFAAYMKDDSFEFIKETSTCGYGFYHGFLEQLLHENPDISLAREFCRNLTIQGKESDSARVTCFHGIGHGLVAEEPLPEYYWGNHLVLMDEGLRVCDVISDVLAEVSECVDGVFNAVILFKSQNKYGYSYDITNPFGWCDDFKENSLYYKFCIYESSQDFAVSVLMKDMSGVWGYIKNLDVHLQEIVVHIAVAGMMQGDIIQPDHSSYVQHCLDVDQAHLYSSCIDGVMLGFSAHGETEKRVLQAYKFCRSAAIKDAGWFDMCDQSYNRYF